MTTERTDAGTEARRNGRQPADLRDHYRARADDDTLTELDRAVAREQLRRLAAIYEQAGSAASGEAAPSFWAYIPLRALFERAGNTVYDQTNGELETGHAPHHTSSSGRCVTIDPQRGLWYCRSCKRGGTAVTLAMDQLGFSHTEAAGWLYTTYGRPAEPEAPRPGGRYRLTETDNARRFIDRERGNVHWCPTLRDWLVWTGRAWEEDRRALVVEKAKATILSIYQEAAEVAAAAAQEPDKAARERLLTLFETLTAWARKSDSAHGIEALLSLARSIPGVTVLLEELDANPWLLNVQNGTIDLRTGRLQRHSRNDLLTRLTPVAYDPRAAAPRWRRFLERIFAGDAELIAYIQRAVGYGATASTREEVLFFLYGLGQNGKSKFLGAIQDALGPYAMSMKFSTFVERDQDTTRFDLADLRGARFVSAIEAGRGVRFNEQLIKSLTGGDTIRAERKFKDAFEFAPSHTLFLAANHKPEIRDTTMAMWRRVKLIPFAVTIPPAERDDHLADTLRAEAPGILAWLVAGGLAWQRGGLGSARAVEAATAEYQSEQDLLGDFLEDRCILDRRAEVVARELYEAYTAWAEAAGLKPLLQKTFGGSLTERGLRRQKRGGVHRWEGIRLGDGPDQTPAEPPSGDDVWVAGPSDEVPDQAHQALQALISVSPPRGCAGVEGFNRENGSNGPDGPGKPPTQDTQGMSWALITTPQQLAEALQELRGAPRIGLDVETAIQEGTPFGAGNETALDPHRGRLRLLQLATAERTYVVDCFAVDPAPLAEVLQGSAELVGHNLAFDLQMLTAAGLTVSAPLFDTMLATQLLEADDGTKIAWAKRAFGLAAVAARYLGEAVDKAEQVSDWSHPVLTAEQLEYAALDARLPLRLADTLRVELEAADLARIAALEFRTVPAMAELQRAGCPFDLAAWRALSDAALAERLRLEGELRSLLALEMPDDPETRPWEPPLGKLGRPLQRKPPAPVWASPARLVALLQRRGHAITDTTDDTILPLAASDPFIRLLRAYREAAKRETTYGITWPVGHVDERGERIYANFHQIGSVAGRMSASRPNLQNIPRSPAYRGCFRPRDGRLLVDIDYSQVELAVAAHYSQDSRFLEAFRTGQDLHERTAAAVLGVSEAEVTKEQRQLAKALNFGLIFGMGAPRLVQHVAGYGVYLTVEQAGEFRTRFLATYRELAAWQRRHGNRAGEQRTVLGRRRLGLTSYTRRLNTPIQGTAADLVKDTVCRVWEDRAAFPTACLVGIIHDELLVECDAGEAPAVAAWLRGHMEAAAGEMIPDVPITAKPAIMRAWGEQPPRGEDGSGGA